MRDALEAKAQVPFQRGRRHPFPGGKEVTGDEHHRKVSFQDEFREVLKRCEVAFDEGD